LRAGAHGSGSDSPSVLADRGGAGSPASFRLSIPRDKMRATPMGTEPISPGAVVARIWEIYRDQFRVLAGTAVVLYGVQFLILLLLGGGSAIFLSVLFWVLSVLYQGMVVKLVQDVQDGRRDNSVADLLGSVSHVFGPLLAVSILFGIGVAIGFVLLIIPGLYLLVIWSVVAPVTVLERPGVFAAFGRSRELVRGNGWAVFGVIVIVYVAVLVINQVADSATSSGGSLVRALVLWVVSSALAPASALSASVLYFELRRAGASGAPVGVV
jgi:hypothetical protein